MATSPGGELTSEFAPEVPLAGLRVVELGDDLVAYCGRLLASLGAEVVLVEPPGGCERRRWADELGGACAAAFSWFHTGKKSVLIDTDTEEGREQLRSLAARADVLLEGGPTGRLANWRCTGEQLRERNARLVVASVSPFGRVGPYREYTATESVLFAMSGMMNLAGNPGEAPVAAPGAQATVVGGAQAAFGVLVALAAVEETGRGQDVEVSVQEAFAAQENVVSAFSGDGWRGERTGSQHRVAVPGRIYPCADGFVHLFISPVQGGAWDRLIEWMGPAAGILRDPAWAVHRYRRAHVDEVDTVVAAWTRQWRKSDLYEEAQRRHIPCAPVNTMSDFAKDPQVVSRGFFLGAAGGDYRYPGPVLIAGGRRRGAESAAPGLDDAQLPKEEVGDNWWASRVAKRTADG